MPFLIALPPKLFDQSFPRDNHEWYQLAVALSTIQDLIDDGSAEIIHLDVVTLLLTVFNWTSGDIPRRQEIYQYLARLVLEGKSVVISPSPDSKHAHPIPAGLTLETESAQLWSEELGRIYVHHAQCVTGAPCVGVPCVDAFSGGHLGSYLAGRTDGFPLVSPETAKKLSDAYEFDISYADINRPITCSDVEEHCRLFGECVLIKPSSGSHYKLDYGAKGSWTLDPNVETLPDLYLKQFEKISGLPLKAVKHVLIKGELPTTRLRI